MKRIILLVCLLASVLSGAHAEVDPNFYIYLCFGQSNMEGNAAAEAVDKPMLTNALGYWPPATMTVLSAPPASGTMPFRPL